MKMEDLLLAMCRMYRGDPWRIQHFIKVHALARTIGRLEGLDSHVLFNLEAAALVHDIGIHASEEKYGSCTGAQQELEGPPLAEKLLGDLGFPAETIRRVSYLVGHHSYDKIDGLDFQILVEADFLVNLYEDDVSAKGVESAYAGVFKTETGRRLCRDMFGI